MTFSKKFLLTLLLPPALFSLPLAFLFLSQVEQLERRGWISLIAMMVAIYGGGMLLFASRLHPSLRALEIESNRRTKKLSDSMSRVLTRTSTASVVLWLGAGLTFCLSASVLVAPSVFDARHYFMAALIAAAPGIAWSYAAAKHLLLDFPPADADIRYSSGRITVAKKIAIVFIGFFIISAAALVQLISSRVSRTLERLAIASSADRFARVYESASVSARVDADTIDTLQDYVPFGFHVFKITPDGKLISKGATLEQREISRIRQIGDGDSSQFPSRHVAKFRRLKDGSVLGLSIPWEPYANIPYQITLYTFVTAGITTLIFILATIFISRDIRGPLRELRRAGAEMAHGNFDDRPRIFSDDEIGELAENFAETRDNLRRLLAKIGGSGAVISRGVQVIGGGTEALLRRSRNHGELTERSTHAIERVREDIEAVVQSAEKVTELTTDTSSRALELHASSEEIARSMGHLFESVEKSSSSTTQMNATAREISGSAETLAGIGDEVLSFVAEMDASVVELRQSSEATAQLSLRVRQAAESGGAAVADTVEGIHQSKKTVEGTARLVDALQSSVGQISRILSVIEDVTEQTNLLALNAAIIASQAGEHGRGFTVVAEEIRSLAERTRGSTKEISGIIDAIREGSTEAVKAIQGNVEIANRNVHLASNASASLHEIVASAARSYDMATRISRALQDQAQASRHLHGVTSRMSDHIGEINRATSEQAGGSDLLAQESDRVREIALQVRMSTDQQSTASRGITMSMEQMASDAQQMRDRLQRQLAETQRVVEVSRALLDIARENDAVAKQFDETVRSLLQSGEIFDTEVSRFRL